MDKQTVITTRDFEHGGRFVASGQPLECSAADAAYYVARNMATYNTRELTAAAPLPAVAPPPTRSRKAVPPPEPTPPQSEPDPQPQPVQEPESVPQDTVSDPSPNDDADEGGKVMTTRRYVRRGQG